MCWYCHITDYIITQTHVTLFYVVRLFSNMIPEAVDANGFPNYTVTQRGHHVRLATYNSTNIKFYEARNVKDKWIDSKFYIVDVPSPTIVGLPLSDQLNIVELHCDITTQQNSVTNTLPNGQLPETSINSIEDLLQFWIISTTVWPYRQSSGSSTLACESGCHLT